MHPSRHNRRRHPEMHTRTARPVFIHIHANHSLMKHIRPGHCHSSAQTQRRLRQYQHVLLPINVAATFKWPSPPPSYFQFSNFNLLSFSPPRSSNPPKSAPYSRCPSPSPVPCPRAPKAPSAPPRCPAHPCPPKTAHPPPSSAP